LTLPSGKEYQKPFDMQSLDYKRQTDI